MFIDIKRYTDHTPRSFDVFVMLITSFDPNVNLPKDDKTPEEIIKDNNLWEAMKKAVGNINDNRVYGGGKSNTPRPRINGVDDYYTAAYLVKKGTIERDKEWNAGHGVIERNNGIISGQNEINSLSGKVIVIGNTRFFVIDTAIEHITPKDISGIISQGFTPMFQWGTVLNVNGDIITEIPLR